MNSMGYNGEVFLALLRAGLWEKNVNLAPYGEVNYNVISQLAEEQAVVGLITIGLENVKDTKVPQEVLLELIGSTLQIEQRNREMNVFIERLIQQLNKNGIYALLVKGQGVAQCYERPLWRICGDVDLLFDSENYEKAKRLLIPMAADVGNEITYFKHLAITIDGWVVELHGTRQTRLSRRIDDELGIIQSGCFERGEVRLWKNGEIYVQLPCIDADVLFVFTHILHHFFFEGIGLRQICDWCRLMWTYRNEIDIALLKQRLQRMNLMSEWQAFASYAVEWLGMPVEAMPLYSKDSKWSRKAVRINNFVLKVGNFGQNQMKLSPGKPYLVRKLLSLWEHIVYVLRQFMIFPLDSVKFVREVVWSGLYGVMKGE